MADKYKLIKEYPGSPGIGYITSFDKNDEDWSTPNMLIISDCKDYPEFWEKIVEKDYEILQFICKDKRGVENVGTILTKRQNGSFWIFPHWTEEEMLKLSHYAIYSIKRLSDGEIFTIGDVCDGVSYERRPIIEFKINENTLSIRQEFGLTKLSNLKKSKTPLFTTEDGISICDGDDVYWIDLDKYQDGTNYLTWTISNIKNINRQKMPINIGKYFAKWGPAIDYIENNKPQFSKKDMLDFATDAIECTKLHLNWNTLSLYNNWLLKNIKK